MSARGLTGNGAHLHASLWDPQGHNLFPDPQGPSRLSPLTHHFLGGLLEHAPALCALTNPIANSYERLARTTPTSGASWSPGWISYGGNNRTHMVRLPDSQRLELRLPDGAANPSPTCCRLPCWRRDSMASNGNWIRVRAVSATPQPRAACGQRLAGPAQQPGGGPGGTVLPGLPGPGPPPRSGGGVMRPGLAPLGLAPRGLALLGAGQLSVLLPKGEVCRTGWWRPYRSDRSLRQLIVAIRAKVSASGRRPRTEPLPDGAPATP